MKKIKEFRVGEAVTTDLLVKEASIKKTKADKPYLLATLTDGSDDIQANDWDYGNNPPHLKNTVLSVTGQVTEYMGKKQLKLIAAVPGSLPVEAFAPQGGVDVNEYTNKAKELMDEIVNEQLRDIVQRVFKNNGAAWKALPAARGIHHAFVAGLLKHSVDVATKAKVMAEIIPYCNKDLCIAGGLIHDMGKLWTYELQGAVIEMSDQGQMIEHIAIGIAKLEHYRNDFNSDIIDLLQHIISSHHGKLEYGSPTTPRFIEAIVVSYADGLDAKTQTLLELNAKAPFGAKQTEKSFIFENRAMYTQQYIEDILN